MIYDFALEPELVAAWHDRGVAYPILCQIGLGHRRVPCLFPLAAWKNLVVRSFRANNSQLEPAYLQQASKNLEVLIRHLHEVGTRRNGRLENGESWLTAATREHAQFPFGGILVRDSESRTDGIVVANRLAEETFPAWSPPLPPVLREANELARALSPLLRCAAQLRFVDPYFDVTDATFFEPMKAYLIAAQRRRTVADLQVQIHVFVRFEDVDSASRTEGRRITEAEFAAQRLAESEARLAPLVKPAVSVRTFAWAPGGTGLKMHNRYILTEIGGVVASTGLDQERRRTGQREDLTLLSIEQYRERWAEFSAEGAAYRLISKGAFRGAAASDS